MSDDNIRKFYRCRQTCCEMLEDRKYAVAEEEKKETYDDFVKRFTERNSLRSNLTLLGTHIFQPENKILVYFGDETKKIGIKLIKTLVDQLEERKLNHAILVGLMPLTSFARNAIADLAPNVHIEFFLEIELLVNITKHELVPKHIKLTDQEKEALLKQYKIKDVLLSKILVTDPVARYLGLKRGNVVKIVRPSESAGRFVTYRLCT